MEFFKPFSSFPNMDTSALDLNYPSYELETETDRNVDSPLVKMEEIDMSVFPTHFDSTQFNSDSQQESNSLPDQTKRKRKKIKENISDIDKILQYLEKKSVYESFDAIEYLFLGYAKTVKSFSPQRQITVKMKIAKLIMEEEIEHYEEISTIK